MKILKKLFSIFLRFFISFILLFILFRNVDYKNIFAVVKNARFDFLFLGLFYVFLAYFFCFVRWWKLIRSINIDLPIRRVIVAFSGGLFFNLFLPSTIGGDVLRTMDLVTHTKKAKEIVATVFLDRLSGYVGMVILALTALLIGWHLVQDPAILVGVFVITGVLIAVLLVLFNSFCYTKINNFLDSSGAGKIKSSIRKFQEQVYVFRNHKGLIIKNVLLSVMVQLSIPLSFYYTGMALGIKISMVYYFVFIPVIGAITMLPISVGGLGLRDASTVFFFAKAGVGKDLAFAMSLLSFAYIIILGLIGGLIYVSSIRYRRIQHAPSPNIPSKSKK